MLLFRQFLIQIKVAYHEDVSMVFADIAMIKRVLTNPIDNSLRHTPEGGKITLALGHRAKMLRLRYSRRTPCQPIRMQLGARQSSSKIHGGGGLGLLISKQILQLHSSTIEVLSEKGGAMFTFNSPVRMAN
ncbi:MAG: ATP-binding protein [Methylobacter sp.]|nr:ATP-binding protein [Methylobacter sp.]